jgi:hypothetical protein
VIGGAWDILSILNRRQISSDIEQNKSIKIEKFYTAESTC